MGGPRNKTFPQYSQDTDPALSVRLDPNIWIFVCCADIPFSSFY